MVQTCCKDTVHLLEDDFSNQIICLYEFSPLLRIASDQRAIQCFKSNLKVLLSNRPNKKISLMKYVYYCGRNAFTICLINVCLFCRLVGTYVLKYRPVLMSGKTGAVVLDIIRDTPNVVISGETLLSSIVALSN